MELCQCCQCCQCCQSCQSCAAPPPSTSPVLCASRPAKLPCGITLPADLLLLMACREQRRRLILRPDYQGRPWRRCRWRQEGQGSAQAGGAATMGKGTWGGDGMPASQAAGKPCCICPCCCQACVFPIQCCPCSLLPGCLDSVSLAGAPVHAHLCCRWRTPPRCAGRKRRYRRSGSACSS